MVERLRGAIADPYRYTGGGVLDDAIDSWHDFFGLPEGARAIMPTDRIRVAYARGAVLLDVQSSQSGLGDISLDFGRSLYDTTSGAVAAWLSVKVPSGDADRLTGSSAADVSLAIAESIDSAKTGRRSGKRALRGSATVSGFRPSRAASPGAHWSASAGMHGAGWISKHSSTPTAQCSTTPRSTSSARHSCSRSAATTASHPAGVSISQ